MFLERESYGQKKETSRDMSDVSMDSDSDSSDSGIRGHKREWRTSRESSKSYSSLFTNSSYDSSRDSDSRSSDQKESHCRASSDLADETFNNRLKSKVVIPEGSLVLQLFSMRGLKRKQEDSSSGISSSCDSRNAERKTRDMDKQHSREYLDKSAEPRVKSRIEIPEKSSEEKMVSKRGLKRRREDSPSSASSRNSTKGSDTDFKESRKRHCRTSDEIRWHNRKILIVGDSRIKDLNKVRGFEDVKVISKIGCVFSQAQNIIREQLRHRESHFELVIVIVGHCEITKKISDVNCLKRGCKDPVWYSLQKENVRPRKIVMEMLHFKKDVESRFPRTSLRFTTFVPVDMVRFNMRQEKRFSMHKDHIDWTCWDIPARDLNPRVRYAQLIGDIRDLQLDYGPKYFLDVWPAFAPDGDLSVLRGGKVPVKDFYKDFFHLSIEGSKAVMQQLQKAVDRTSTQEMC